MIALSHKMVVFNKLIILALRSIRLEKSTILSKTFDGQIYYRFLR